MALAGRYIIVNPGSTSRKYAFFDQDELVVEARYERLANSEYSEQITHGDDTTERTILDYEFTHAFECFYKHIAEQTSLDDNPLAAIGVRIVAPGSYFQEHRMIDAVFIDKLRNTKNAAPLHITPVLQELEQIQKQQPETPIIGISDSYFHRTIPEAAYRYAIAKHDADQHDLRRFGYHGISVASIVALLKEQYQSVPERTIVLHLGGGASITALKNGVSIDTTMGFTPVSGLVMASRSGDIDAGALLYLADQLQLSPEAVQTYLNTESGLKGLVSDTDDLRLIMERAAAADPDAQLARDMYIHRIRKFIGAFATELGGLDALVFTGAVGERNAEIRELVCQNFSFVGLQIHEATNKGDKPVLGEIQATQSDVKVLVLPTEEIQQMKHYLVSVLQKTA